MFGASDLDAIFADDMAVSVVYGTETTRGHFDSGERVDQSTGTLIMINVKTVRVKTDSLTGLAKDAAITIDETAYQIREWQPEDDGLTTLITVA